MWRGSTSRTVIARSIGPWPAGCDASRETGRTVALMQDIQGPKLRVGEFANGRVTLEPGVRSPSWPRGHWEARA